MKRIALVLLMAALPTIANANLLVNGSFEADAQAAGTWNIYPSLTGWTGLNNIELRNNVAGQASDGVNFVELDTNSNNSMYQSINTVLGQVYTLSFDYSGREGVAANSNPIKAFWGNEFLTQAKSTGVGNSGNNWTNLTFEVIGTGGIVNLKFSAVGTSDSFGGSLDNVILTAVPEPSTYGMMLAGLALIGFTAGRRKF